MTYGKTTVIDGLNLHIQQGKITVLIGSNGCGKSALLRTLARLLKPAQGSVILDGREMIEWSTKEVARRLAVLPQGAIALEGLTVLQLVKQGRYPYQSLLRQWSEEDEMIVNKALEATRMETLADRPVDSLSGGQRQKAWIAMVLAQGSDILLLDEPTTYLDMTHQIEILDLLFELNRKERRTIVMVLHDLNLACRYADHIVAVRNKTIYDQGKPEDIMTSETVQAVFQMRCQITKDPLFGTPLFIPYGKGRKVHERCNAILA
ncbi:ABC transporter ATP-binding protein [uncultured Paenibacillus sp.]|uniref:ABC transporter ATP-binding protein n=1 Tax=uncultured Paenibacillus sp. TaxID=227322 RepID=UPI0028D7BB42|nr:ABC transporter ATP-binding protein [uncultured Paenibacillus sp.]